MASLKQDDSFLREIELLESNLITDKPKQSSNVMEMLDIPTVDENIIRDMIIRSKIMLIKDKLKMSTEYEPVILEMMMKKKIIDVKMMLGLPPSDDLDELSIRDIILRSKTWDIKMDKSHGYRQLFQDIGELKDCVYIQQVDDTMCKERLELLIHTLEKISNRKSKGLTHMDKPMASQLDNRIAEFPLHHAQLKESLPSLGPVKDASGDFKIFLDCKQFQLKELKLAVENGYIVVCGKHDMKMDAHGLTQREFTRRWPIPKDVKCETFSCLLNRYGVLAIRAPRVPPTIAVSIQTQKL